jgi:hypothetical protein
MMVGRDGELRRLAELATAGRPEMVVRSNHPLSVAWAAQRKRSRTE